MRLKFIIVLTVGLFAAAATAVAQPSVDTNHSVEIRREASLRFPADVENMFYLDGMLHFYTGGMLMAAPCGRGFVGDAGIDTALLSIDEGLNYAVRNPSTDVLFFTKKDRKGKNVLYECYYRKNNTIATRKVSLAGFSYSVEHPVFSPDGKAMVFSSDCPLGMGGTDLWYSMWVDGSWQYPQNMGPRVNSTGDDVAPMMYGDFLIFSSNGRADSAAGYEFYSTRFLSLQQQGDTVSMYPVGMSPSFRLDAPFCSEGNDKLFVVNDKSDEGWWVSELPDGQDCVYGFIGRLDCVKLYGRIIDNEGNAVPNSVVVLRRYGLPDVLVHGNADGVYALYVQPSVQCNIDFKARGYFSASRTMRLVRFDENELYYALHYDVTLFSLALDSAYIYTDLFNSRAGCELSMSGCSRVDMLARFMTDNPELKLTVISLYSGSNDASFCGLLNEARNKTVFERLVAAGIPKTSIVTGGEKPQGFESAILNNREQAVLFIFSR